MNMTENNIFLSPQVEPNQQGQRLDRFLSECFKQLSRSQIQRLIAAGNLSCDDNLIVDNAFKVRCGDIYQLEIPEPEEANPEPEDIPLDIVYEDKDLIVVNKPAGMTVHPAPGAYGGTLVNALLFHCKDNLSGIGGVKRPGIVHRIDKDTSGLIVAAKNDITHRGLCDQFFVHSIERTYQAIVYGTPNPLQGKIETNIGRSPYDRKKMAVLQSGGKVAITNYKTLEIFGRAASLVECKLETGRTHQIRVHMSSLGCNLIGDKVYEKAKRTSIVFGSDELKKEVLTFPRQALHAKTLGFVHPVLGLYMQFSSELPDDMSMLLNRLRNQK